jgi:hypothetical protein
MKTSAAIATLLSVEIPLSAASFTLGKPEDVGMSSKRLERIGTAPRLAFPFFQNTCPGVPKKLIEIHSPKPVPR